MSAVNLTFSGTELACIYGAVSAELDSLQEDLENPETLESDKVNFSKSVSVCQSVLAKLSASDASITFHE